MLRNTMMEDTGLINRFLLSLPGDLVGKRQGRPSTFIDDQPEHEDGHLKAWWADLLDSLVQYDVIDAGRIADETPIIDLTREAWKLHYDFQEAFEPRMDASRGGDLARVRGWASKHCGRVLRIAAHLHVASGWTTDDRVGEKTMRSAISIGDWALEHFLHVGKVVGLSEGAGRIKEFIDGRDLKFASRSEINVEVFRKNVTSDQLTTWINELIETGEYEYARLPTGGRAKTVVRKVGARAGEAHAA
jgi:hypothetical protein